MRSHETRMRDAEDAWLEPPAERLLICFWCGGTGKYRSYRLRLESWCLNCNGNGDYPASAEHETEDAQDEHCIDENEQAGKIRPAAAAVMRIQIRNDE